MAIIHLEAGDQVILDNGLRLIVVPQERVEVSSVSLGDYSAQGFNQPAMTKDSDDDDEKSVKQVTAWPVVVKS